MWARARGRAAAAPIRRLARRLERERSSRGRVERDDRRAVTQLLAPGSTEASTACELFADASLRSWWRRPSVALMSSAFSIRSRSSLGADYPCDNGRTRLNPTPLPLLHEKGGHRISGRLQLTDFSGRASSLATPTASLGARPGRADFAARAARLFGEVAPSPSEKQLQDPRESEITRRKETFDDAPKATAGLSKIRTSILKRSGSPRS